MQRIILIAAFCAASLYFAFGITSAQTTDFSQTGQIQAIVSETETENPSWKGAAFNAGFKFEGRASSKTDFYFTYSVFQDGLFNEKWIRLPEDGNWSLFSNQPVRVSGKLKDKHLLNASALPLNEIPANYLSSPPPTTGLYKIVAVPLTIQTGQPSGEKSDKQNEFSSVTPEQIRNVFFNAPDSVNKFYLEASYGKLSFTGVHHPQIDVVPVTISANISANCQEQIMTDFTQIVRQRLLEQNINTANGSLDIGIIVFNDTPGCPPYPFATRGALGQRGAPLWLWMPESWFVTGSLIMTHEIGHVLGGNHPYALRCADFDNPQSCVAVEAADRDFMTSGITLLNNKMPNNYERRRWGWHPPRSFDNPLNGSAYFFDLHSPVLPFIKENSKQGRFYFRNLAGSYFEWDIYPEARRNWGQFEKYQAADESFRAGITVRIGHSNYGDPEALSILLDPNNTATFEDAPLREGQQISIGGTMLKCLREQNPVWGTRMRVQ